MKNIFLFLITFTFSSNSLATELCQVKMENAAIFDIAQQEGKSVREAKIVRFEMGPWTEMSGGNNGSGQVALAFGYVYGTDVYYYDVFAKQVGASEDCNLTKLTSLDPKTIDPIALQAERYKMAIRDAVYMSEADVVWRTFYSNTSVDEDFPIEQVKLALNSGSLPVEVWSNEKVLETLYEYINDNPYKDVIEQARYGALKIALLMDFKELRMFKVGKPDSGALDLYLVGRNKDGRLVGLRTITIET